MFEYLIVIEPLGFLYGSAGRFLSPENLVGRSGTSFPPSAASLSGLFASVYYEQDKAKLEDLRVAGPFWTKNGSDDNINNFYVPTPFHCLVKEGKIAYQMYWQKNKISETIPEENGLKGKWVVENKEQNKWDSPPVEKFTSGTWIAINDWHQENWVGKPIVEQVPWKFLSHLHPRLEEEQRRVHVETERDRGSLFLENSVQLDPDYCLVYLSNTELPENWYRFGGEGHMVAVKCVELSKFTKEILKKPLKKSFALITSAVWGSNRLSSRFPMMLQCDHPQQQAWKIDALLTERPHPYRYRLGGKGKVKRLSRGRYAVSAGSVYVLQEEIPAWQFWTEAWFPKEAYSFKRWGCGLALPLPSAIAVQD